VLLIGMPAPADLHALASRLTHGLIAVIVSEEEVYEGRRLARDVDNVMFTPPGPAGSVPWRDAFFTIIYAPEMTPEIKRVLSPTGSCIVPSVRGVTLIQLPSVADHRGSLTFGEVVKQVPYEVKLFFLIHGVPENSVRGEHAHRRTRQFLVCAHGSCEVIVDDGANRREYRLDSPSSALIIEPMVWAVQHKYSHDAVLLVLASHPYDASEYIRDYAEFQRLVQGA
jgi:hypothetical protein